jgi:prepilin-type processing-associated H-X9-DG protein
MLGLPGNTLEYAREDQIKAPENMIALGDLFLRSKNPSFDATINFEPIIMPWGIMNSTKTPNRKQPAYIAHHGRCNRAFVDGHLESEDLRRNYEARDDQLAQWNNDNLPHRELLVDRW